MSRSILFVTPPYHCGVVEVAGRWLPLGFVYLAAAARRAGWTPLIYDAMTLNHDHEQIRHRLAELKPDVVATTAITATFPDALEVLRSAKALLPGVVTQMGGVHPTFLAEDILREHGDVVDAIIRGEGEQTLEEWLRALDAGTPLDGVRGLAFCQDGAVVQTPHRPFADSIEFEHQAWDLIDWDDYPYFPIKRSRLATVSTARGCSFDCTFCSQQKFWKQSWRGRDPQAAVDEILMLRERHGVNVVMLADEYPTKDPDRWRDFLDRLIAARYDGHLLMETRAADIVRDASVLDRYRQAGIIHVYVGLEATDQATLDVVKKDLRLDESIESLRLLRQHGMVSETSFVLGFPWETAESVDRTLELAKTFNPDMGHFLAITPWPYADLYEEMKPHIAVTDLRKYNLIDPIIKPTAMTLEDVDRAIVSCYRRFYMARLGELENDPDPFRRDYMLTSMRLVMRSSFLQKKLGSLGRIPVEIDKILSRLKGRPTS